MFEKVKAKYCYFEYDPATQNDKLYSKSSVRFHAFLSVKLFLNQTLFLFLLLLNAT